MKFVLALLLLIGAANAQLAPTAPVAQNALHAVKYYALRYGVQPELVEAIIDEESAWNPYAVSSKGAAGLMQLMPRTAVRFRVHNRFLIDENIRGGVAYVAWLTRIFHGDLRLIAAAYYVGEQPIRARGLAYSSPEVQQYVKRVARRYRFRRWLRSQPGDPTESQVLR
jgi:soluble lytic murein transglycosylase-like protein